MIPSFRTYWEVDGAEYAHQGWWSSNVARKVWVLYYVYVFSFLSLICPNFFQIFKISPCFPTTTLPETNSHFAPENRAKSQKEGFTGTNHQLSGRKHRGFRVPCQTWQGEYCQQGYQTRRCGEATTGNWGRDQGEHGWGFVGVGWVNVFFFSIFRWLAWGLLVGVGVLVWFYSPRYVKVWVLPFKSYPPWNQHFCILKMDGWFRWVSFWGKSHIFRCFCC